MSVRIIQGDCRDILPTLPAESVQCVVTSPPYWGLRDYGTATWDGGDPACDHLGPPVRTQAGFNARYFGREFASDKQGEEREPMGQTCRKCGARRIDAQLGLEATPEAYVAAMVGVFREVRRVLRADGTLWLNMGDSYSSGSGGDRTIAGDGRVNGGKARARDAVVGAKPKDLVGMPWRLAFALQADGWFLRADIIWAKPNPMPESVTDRPTKAHEYVFLLTKSARYFYDADAVREPAEYGRVPSIGPMWNGIRRADHRDGRPGGSHAMNNAAANPSAGRNLRSVWTIATAAFPEAHFATFPPALVARCLQAGSSERGCCRVCGAPWIRQRAKVGTVARRWSGNDLATHGDNGRHDNGNTTQALYATTGFAPACVCTAAPPIPCTVLDPFGGSGTVGEVAERHGRHSVLIELSPQYVAMLEARTAQCGLFAQGEP